MTLDCFVQQPLHGITRQLQTPRPIGAHKCHHDRLLALSFAESASHLVGKRRLAAAGHLIRTEHDLVCAELLPQVLADIRYVAGLSLAVLAFSVLAIG